MSSKSSSRQIVSAAIILGVASLISRLVGLVRERVMTTTFGAGDTFDAFVAAFRLPDLIFNLIVVGALSAAFIPLFTEKLVNKKKAEEAWLFANSILNLVVIVVAALSLGYAFFAPTLVPLITPGFSGEKLEQTIMLTRIMALQPILLSMSFVCSGILNSFKRFVAYALAPILYNVGIIIGVVFIVPALGIAGLGWGVVLGALFHLAVQFPSTLNTGYSWQWIVQWNSGDVRKLLKMVIPRMFGLAGQQVNLFLVTIIGSTLAAGSITVFHLANNVQSLPIGMFGLAFAQAAFPTMAEQYSRKQDRAFLYTVTRSFRYILFFVIPITVFFFLLRAQLIRVLFGAGAFDWEDTILTFETFGLLLISLFAQATIPLLARAFYVRQNTLIPVLVSLVSIVINIVLAVTLAPTMGVEGLALAFSIAAIVHLLLLLAVLHWHLGGFDDKAVIRSLFFITISAIVGGIFVQILKYPFAAIVDMQRFWGVLVQLIGSFSGGVGVYLLLCSMFKLEELQAIKRFMPRTLQVKPPPGTETARFGGITE